MQRCAESIVLLSVIALAGSTQRAIAQAGTEPSSSRNIARQAETQDAPEPTNDKPEVSGEDTDSSARLMVEDICRHTDLFANWYRAKSWQTNFPILLLNLRTKSLFWTPRYSAPLMPIRYQAFTPRISTTDNLIVLICNARQGDGSTVNATSVVVNGPDANEGANFRGAEAPAGQIDRIFLLEAAKGNDRVKVDFQGPTSARLARDQAAIDRDKAKLAADQAAINPHEQDPVKAAAAKAQVEIDKTKLADDSKKWETDAAASRTTDRVTDTIATVIVDRHKVIHFSAGAGLLFTEGRSRSYSMLTVPTTVTTTTTISSTTVLTGTTTVVGSNTQTTPVVTNGAASFAFSTLNDRPQINAIAGLTWYPFGHDTFPVGENKGYAVTYASHSLTQSLGLFFGTSVSSLGNFTVAPALEVRPGIQVFAGPSWYSRPYLPANIIACSGYGTSPAYAGPTTTSTQVQSVPGPPATTTTTTTTVTISSTNGCANGDRATLLSGSSLPTDSHYVTAFAFGVLFNSNLFKAFSGIK